GRIGEAEFLAASRPWPRYATDYRALVLLARARGWPVVAANIPRSLAAAVSTKGLAALDALPPDQRSWAASENRCPHDAYFARFQEVTAGHAMPDRSMSDRFFEAQCVKDEAMGESIARALAASPGAIVVHFNGTFHTDFAQGTAERAKRRAPSAKTIVITAMPVTTPETAPFPSPKLADFVILTRTS